MNVTRAIRRFAAVLPLAAMAVLLSGCMENVVVLNPKGAVGKEQLDLIILSTLLCLVVILPVLVLTFVIAWRYRHRPERKAAYQPEWEHSTKLEAIWWGVPIVIILILAVVTSYYTHKLEPSKPLESDAKPIVIQVTSLDWKWLFQYPEQGIATVNYIKFPEDVPVRFELTSDAPMNSFWIPQLGGQIYTMSGMSMKLHLIADEPGTYMGSGANFSGKDFAKMRFDAEAVSQAEFDDWVQRVKGSSQALTQEGYEELAKPGVVEGTRNYSSFPEGLYESIVTKYAVDGDTGHHHGAEEPAGEPAKEPEPAAEAPSPSPSSHHHH